MYAEMSYLRHFGGQYCMETLRVLITDCQGPMLLLLRVLAARRCWIPPSYCQPTRSKSDYVRFYCLNYEHYQTVPAVTWYVTDTIGNLLGLRTAVYHYCHYMGSTLYGGYEWYSHILRLLAALKCMLIVLPVYSEYDVY